MSRLFQSPSRVLRYEIQDAKNGAFVVFLVRLLAGMLIPALADGICQMAEPDPHGAFP